MWIDSHAFGTVAAHIRSHFDGTLASGGGWTFLPTQGGAMARDGAVWS